MSRISRELRRGFAEVLADVEVWGLYVRTDRRFPHPGCRNPMTGDAPAGCAGCFGTGYRAELERWRFWPTSTLTRARYLDAPPVGIGASPEHTPVLFTRATEKPVVGDRFFLVEWDRSPARVPFGGQPTALVEAYRVTFVDRQYAGALIYHAAHCELVTEDHAGYERAILNTPVRITRNPLPERFEV